MGGESHGRRDVERDGSRATSRNIVQLRGHIHLACSKRAIDGARGRVLQTDQTNGFTDTKPKRRFLLNGWLRLRLYDFRPPCETLQLNGCCCTVYVFFPVPVSLSWDLLVDANILSEFLLFY